MEKGRVVGNSRTCEGKEMPPGWAGQGQPGTRQARQERPARGLPSLSLSSNEAPLPPGTLSTLSSHPQSCLLSHEFIHQHLLSTYYVPGVVLDKTPTMGCTGRFPE